MGYECYKCGGTGEVSFRHIANGVCFACGGTGRLDRRASSKLVKLNYQPVAEDVRCTDKQWAFFGKLVLSDAEACRILKKAGAPCATQDAVTRAVMSRAIEMARGT